VIRRLLLPALLLAPAAFLLAGCGGSSSGGFPTIEAARVYSLANFRPASPPRPGRPTTVSFTVRQPNGEPLVHYKRGPGPHTGVHLIIVRDDLSTIIHQHPPIAPNGTAKTTVTFPAPGLYRAVVDVYPASGPQRNFQLFRTIRVAGPYKPKPVPPPARSVTVGGYRFTLDGASNLKAIQAQDVVVHVTDPNGKPVQFTPWFGALAHAIFFRRGSLDYFHTHVCAPGATGCTSILGGTKVTGTSSTPGKLNVGVLVPAPGTWRLFLQVRANGRVLTAPFTLRVS
jgi:hypothetical protein